jgi:hypothetical protein
MTTNEFELWESIKAFRFDKPNVTLTFAKRLARENNFSESFANEIIEEYKKFIFLCCVSKHQVTPSHYVDLVWHLHLTYTKSYWIELCKNTIHREIHHNPTEGGRTESNKFRNCYNDTIELYKAKFKKNPPLHIWQNDVERFKNRTIQIDANKNWVVPKPAFFKLKSNFTLFFVLAIFPLLLLGCNQASIAASSILIFAVLFGVLIFIVSNQKNNPNKNNDNSSDASSGCGAGYVGDSHHDSGSDSSGGGDGGGDSGCSGCGGGD